VEIDADPDQDRQAWEGPDPPKRPVPDQVPVLEGVITRDQLNNFFGQLFGSYGFVACHYHLLMCRVSAGSCGSSGRILRGSLCHNQGLSCKGFVSRDHLLVTSVVDPDPVDP
jgi:hypothetical protein